MTATEGTTDPDTDDGLEVLLEPGALLAGLEADARAGLTAHPKHLPPKYFYDARGSRLFDQITQLPEYYPTRTEHALLTEHASDVARASGAEVLLELGSGSSTKSRLLLDAMTATGTLRGYAPLDVSSSALVEAAGGLRRRYPGLDVRPVVADFDQDLSRLPLAGRRMVALLGSTIGNYPPPQRQRFLSRVAAGLLEGETLLLGADLVKAPERLVAAYDDAAGVTAEFNRNVLRVLNRELDARFDSERFDHVAVWDEQQEWIEMRLRARETMRVPIAALDLEVTLDEGEEIRTEVSAKFRRPVLEAELGAAGLRLEGWWTDPAGDYALALARR